MVRRLNPFSKRAWMFIGIAIVGGLVLVGAAGGLVWWDKQRTEAARAEQLEPMIQRIAGEYGLDPSLVWAVIDAESSFDANAVSSKDALGLMQITDITHREVMNRRGLPDGDLFDPEYNLTVGCAYLRQLLTRFDGDLHLSLAAYHMGPTRTARLRRKHPNLSSADFVQQHAYRSTRAYVTKVLETHARLIATPPSP
ncbi:MAG: lytic transglycosylase domain-containing protein [Planctomycetota bacterium]